MTQSTLGRWIDRLGKLIVFVAMIGFTGMLLATGAQVVFRYALQISVGWTEELARVLFVLSMFLGIAVAIREREHIVVDFLFKKLPVRARALGSLVFDVAILLFLIWLLRGAARMAEVMWDSSLIAMTWLTNGHLYVGECFAILLMMLYVVLGIIENARILRFGEAATGGEGDR